MSAAHDDLGGLNAERLPDPRTFFGGGVKLLADWDCPAARCSSLFQEIIRYFRASGWREPPSSAPGQDEWRRRASYRLPPERVQVNAQRVRDQLNASKHPAAGPATPVGSDARNGEAEEGQASG